MRRPVGAALLVASALVATAGAVGLAFGPWFLTIDPLVLVWMCPVDRHLIVAAAIAPVVPFFVVAVARRSLSAALGYGLGREYGETGVTWVQGRYPRLGRFIDPLSRRVNQSFAYTLLLAPWPSVVGGISGVVRMRAFVFVPIALIGQIGWVAFDCWVGMALGEILTPFVTFIRAHVAGTTAVCAGLACFAWWNRARQRAALQKRSESEKEPSPIMNRGGSRKSPEGDSSVSSGVSVAGSVSPSAGSPFIGSSAAGGSL